MSDNEKTDKEALDEQQPSDLVVPTPKRDKVEEDAEVAAGLYHDLYFHDLI